MQLGSWFQAPKSSRPMLKVSRLGDLFIYKMQSEYTTGPISYFLVEQSGRWGQSLISPRLFSNALPDHRENKLCPIAFSFIANPFFLLLFLSSYLTPNVFPGLILRRAWSQAVSFFFLLFWQMIPLWNIPSWYLKVMGRLKGNGSLQSVSHCLDKHGSDFLWEYSKMLSAAMTTVSWQDNLSQAGADVRCLIISGAPWGPVVRHLSRSPPGFTALSLRADRGHCFLIGRLVFSAPRRCVFFRPLCDSRFRCLRHCSLFVGDSEWYFWGSLCRESS